MGLADFQSASGFETEMRVKPHHPRLSYCKCKTKSRSPSVRLLLFGSTFLVGGSYLCYDLCFGYIPSGIGPGYELRSSSVYHLTKSDQYVSLKVLNAHPRCAYIIYVLT